MLHKYVRHSELGFIVFQNSKLIYHEHIARFIVRQSGGNIVSAGFCMFFDDKCVCNGRSESLNLASHPDDSTLATTQFFK